MAESNIVAPPPKHVKKTVCRLYPKLNAASVKWCKFCLGKTVEEIIGGKTMKKIVQQADWATEGVLIWDITQLLKELLPDVKIAHGLLQHLRPSTSGNHSLLHSKRAKHWRQACQVHDTTSYVMSEVPCPFTTHYYTCCLGICATR
jgi:hypothetical protein